MITPEPTQRSILASARDKRPLAVRNRIMTNRNPVIGLDPVAILLQRRQHLPLYCGQLREGFKQQEANYGAGYFLVTQSYSRLSFLTKDSPFDKQKYLPLTVSHSQTHPA